MARTRRKFSGKFKHEAVRQVVERSRPATEVARELDIHVSLLSRWRRDLIAAGYFGEDDPSPPTTHQFLSSLFSLL